MKIKIIFMLFTLVLSMTAMAQVGYSLAKINLNYGMLEVGAGGGSLNILVDKDQQIMGVGVDVLGGVLGFDEHVVAALTLEQMKSGHTLNYVLSGADKPIFKVTALKGFGAFGGKVRVSIRNENGFQSRIGNISIHPRTGRYYLWQDDKIVYEIDMNLRGYGFSEAYVGWYDWR